MLRKHVVEVIYPKNAITAKHKDLLETILVPFSIMSRIMLVGQRALTIAIEAANGPLVYSLFFVLFGCKLLFGFEDLKVSEHARCLEGCLEIQSA